MKIVLCGNKPTPEELVAVLSRNPQKRKRRSRPNKIGARTKSPVVQEKIRRKRRGRAPEYPPIRWISKDGMRQVRYARHEMLGKGKEGHHAHFEAYDVLDHEGGRVMENLPQEITNYDPNLFHQISTIKYESHVNRISWTTIFYLGGMWKIYLMSKIRLKEATS